jgi:predicted lipid-binding transport protein (Tim44 family)
MKLGVVLSMGRRTVGIAVAGVLVVLLGVGTLVTMRSNGGSSNAKPVVNSAASGNDPAPVDTTIANAVPAKQPAATTATTKAPTAASGASATAKAPEKAPAAATTPSSVPRTPQEIQQFVAGITASLQASLTNSNVAPLTKEQVDAQIREQLKLLGITY